MDYIKVNQEIWDEKVASSDRWTQPVSSEKIKNAREGVWHIDVTPVKQVPRDWFPEEMQGKKVLCLASGGGQQGPIIAALGAEVTVFDNSLNQLKQDTYVAERDNLTIKTIQGDMKNLSVFEDETFDLIIHPWSNVYIDNVLPVWRESFRVLKEGGVLISGFSNPVEFIFDLKSLNEGNFVVRHKLPYSDLSSITEEELKELVIDQGEGVAFGHTLENQINGQIEAGFLIGGFYEDIGGSPLDAYMNSSIATKAIKVKKMG